jgi:hypothetical protein
MNFMAAERDTSYDQLVLVKKKQVTRTTYGNK